MGLNGFPNVESGSVETKRDGPGELKGRDLTLRDLKTAADLHHDFMSQDHLFFTVTVVYRSVTCER